MVSPDLMEVENDTYMRGYLMNLEILADIWGLIDTSKYQAYRCKKDITKMITKNIEFLFFFNLGTFKLAC